MKIQITEIQAHKLFNLVSEDKKKDKDFEEKSKWFRESKCLLKQYPKLELAGTPYSATFKEKITDWFDRENYQLYVVYPDGEMVIDTPRRDSLTARIPTYYKWNCKGEVMNIERDNEKNEKLEKALWDKDPINSNKSQKNIKQAKSISDVENNKGYIIEKMQGEHVRELQKMLMQLVYDLGSTKDDGIFGDMTKKAVEKFQKDVGIKPKNSIYGIFGPITLKKLKGKLKEKGL